MESYRGSRMAVVLTALISAVGGVWLLTSIHAATASLKLSPATQTVAPNQQFDVQVQLTTDDTVNAVQANLSFPSNLLDVVPPVSNAGSPFEIQAENDISPGSVKIARGTNTPVSGANILVATVTFKAKAAGTATVKFANGSAVIRSSDNANIYSGGSDGNYTISTPASPTPTPTPSPTPSPGAKPSPSPTPPAAGIKNSPTSKPAASAGASPTPSVENSSTDSSQPTDVTSETNTGTTTFSNPSTSKSLAQLSQPAKSSTPTWIKLLAAGVLLLAALGLAIYELLTRGRPALRRLHLLHEAAAAPVLAAAGPAVATVTMLSDIKPASDLHASGPEMGEINLAKPDQPQVSDIKPGTTIKPKADIQTDTEPEATAKPDIEALLTEDEPPVVRPGMIFKPEPSEDSKPSL
jgi:hypothetical protein